MAKRAFTKSEVMNAAEVLDPWLNGDPCENCEKCERICIKLQERIDSAIAKARAGNLTSLDGMALVPQKVVDEILNDMLISYNKLLKIWGEK